MLASALYSVGEIRNLKDFGINRYILLFIIVLRSINRYTLIGDFHVISDQDLVVAKLIQLNVIYLFPPLTSTPSELIFHDTTSIAQCKNTIFLRNVIGSEREIFRSKL